MMRRIFLIILFCTLGFYSNPQDLMSLTIKANKNFDYDGIKNDIYKPINDYKKIDFNINPETKSLKSKFELSLSTDISLLINPPKIGNQYNLYIREYSWNQTNLVDSITDGSFLNSDLNIRPKFFYSACLEVSYNLNSVINVTSGIGVSFYKSEPMNILLPWSQGLYDTIVAGNNFLFLNLPLYLSYSVTEKLQMSLGVRYLFYKEQPYPQTYVVYQNTPSNADFKELPMSQGKIPISGLFKIEYKVLNNISLKAQGNFGRAFFQPIYYGFEKSYNNQNTPPVSKITYYFFPKKDAKAEHTVATINVGLTWRL